MYTHIVVSTHNTHDKNQSQKHIFYTGLHYFFFTLILERKVCKQIQCACQNFAKQYHETLEISGNNDC